MVMDAVLSDDGNASLIFFGSLYFQWLSIIFRNRLYYTTYILCAQLAKNGIILQLQFCHVWMVARLPLSRVSSKNRPPQITPFCEI